MQGLPRHLLALQAETVVAARKRRWVTSRHCSTVLVGGATVSPLLGPQVTGAPWIAGTGGGIAGPISVHFQKSKWAYTRRGNIAGLIANQGTWDKRTSVIFELQHLGGKLEYDGPSRSCPGESLELSVTACVVLVSSRVPVKGSYTSDVEDEDVPTIFLHSIDRERASQTMLPMQICKCCPL